MGKKITSNNARKHLIEALLALSKRHGIQKVFTDFVEMYALAISNAVDKTQLEQREGRYLEIIKGYSPAEIEMLPALMAHAVNAFEAEARKGFFRDILGEVFHELNLHDVWKKQFFTPHELSLMMGRLSVINDSPSSTGRIDVMECCIGSGALVLGYINAVREQDASSVQRIYVEGMDTDLKCVHMAYIQLSLYGISARIDHGNALTQERWSSWYTPCYYFYRHSR